MNRALSLLLLVVLLVTSATACKGEKCYTPTPPDEVRSEFLEEVDEAMDAMDATDAQREAVRREANALITRTLALRKQREPLKEAMIAEIQSEAPSNAEVKKLARQMSAPATKLYHDLVDVTLEMWPDFERDQRVALAEHLQKPFEPMEESWLVDQFIEYQLNDLEATEAQRDMVRKLKKDYHFKINVLRRQGYHDRQVIFEELKRDKPNKRKVHALVDAGARRYDRLVAQLVDDGERLLATATPAQRTKLDAQFDRARTCPDAEF